MFNDSVGAVVVLGVGLILTYSLQRVVGIVVGDRGQKKCAKCISLVVVAYGTIIKEDLA